ncbi:MAG: hypothetical protein IJ409_02630 [Lachnospiraceae bacterium]|nr:hypothetical protein [Lachnospiraceae bacterium]
MFMVLSAEYTRGEEGLFTPVKNKTNMIKCHKLGDVSLTDVMKTVITRMDIQLDEEE